MYVNPFNQCPLWDTTGGMNQWLDPDTSQWLLDTTSKIALIAGRCFSIYLVTWVVLPLAWERVAPNFDGFIAPLGEGLSTGANYCVNLTRPSILKLKSVFFRCFPNVVNRNSLLHDLVTNGTLNSFQTLNSLQMALDFGIDVNSQNDKGETPLHLANTTDKINLLLGKGADVTIKNNTGRLPVHYFAVLFDSWLEAWVDPEVRQREKLLEVFRALSNNGVLINEKTPEGDTPLHLTNDSFVQRVLIALGADLTLENNEGLRPLDREVRVKSDVGVRTLIEEGASTLSKNSAGHSPLDIFYDNPAHPNFLFSNPIKDISKYLFLHGADVNAKDPEGDTALLRFLKNLSTDIEIDDLCKFLAPLLNHPSLEVNSVDSSNHTALDYLLKIFLEHQTSADLQDLIRLFLKKGAKVTGPDPETWDNAMHMIVKGYTETNLRVILPLLDKNCPHLRLKINKKKLTPIFTALLERKTAATSYFHSDQDHRRKPIYTKEDVGKKGPYLAHWSNADIRASKEVLKNAENIAKEDPSITLNQPESQKVETILSEKIQCI